MKRFYILSLITIVALASIHSDPGVFTISKNRLLGRVSPKNDTNLVRVNKTYTSKDNLYLEKNTYEAFKKMHINAQNDGIELRIISGFRSFYQQKWIWEQKWTGKRLVDGKNLSKTVKDSVERARLILQYSSMPGTSRHHWGTDIDLYALNNHAFEKGEGRIIYQWLQENAAKYGFCQVYSAKGDKRSFGYEEEKWHWSYLPEASKFLASYLHKINYSHIQGFEGCNTAKEVKAIEHYVQGLNTECVREDIK